MDNRERTEFIINFEYLLWSTRQVFKRNTATDLDKRFYSRSLKVKLLKYVLYIRTIQVHNIVYIPIGHYYLLSTKLSINNVYYLYFIDTRYMKVILLKTFYLIDYNIYNITYHNMQINTNKDNPSTGEPSLLFTVGDLSLR